MAYKLRKKLGDYASKFNAQNDEDGIIEAIFADIPARSKFFVEFGIGPNWLDKEYVNGLEGNCVRLRHNGWKGLFMDGGNHPEAYEIRREFITPINFNSLLRKYNVPEDVDLISIDVDGQDLWIWMACDYRPSLFILEYNPNLSGLEVSKTVAFNPSHVWDGTKYYGASLGALIKIGYDKGYKLVYANGCNAFFLRLDLFSNPEDFVDQELAVFFEQHAVDTLNRPWVEI